MKLVSGHVYPAKEKNMAASYTLQCSQHCVEGAEKYVRGPVYTSYCPPDRLSGIWL